MNLEASVLGIHDVTDPEQIKHANYQKALRQSLAVIFPDVKGRSDKRKLNALISTGSSYYLADEVKADPSLIGQTIVFDILVDDDVDTWLKSRANEGGAFTGRLTKKQLDWLEVLLETDRIEQQFNAVFFSNGDSREPELAGIRSAITGSLFTLFVTLLLSFTVGISSAIYLEEYAPKNKFTAFIEVNINNLAAIPSIIFGLLGLLLFIGELGVPRSSPLAGGLTLGLMMLPIIIISTRASLRSIPNSIREAALAIGASKWQTVQHHVVPLAIPGIVTGSILSMAQAMGETAPLLMVGLNSSVTETPSSLTDDSNSLPTLIFQWSNAAERGFSERTAAAILIMLIILIVMNGLAVWMRNKFERRW